MYKRIILMAITLILSLATAAFSLTSPSTKLAGEASPTPTAGHTRITITGTLTNGSAAALSLPLAVTLHLYDTQANQEVQMLLTTVQADGRYRFDDVPANTHMAYVVSVEYGTVFYISEAVLYDGTGTVYDLPITVYDAVEDWSLLTLEQLRLNFDFSNEGMVQVVELYILSLAGQQAVIVASDGTSVPFINVPAEAADVQYQLASGSAPLLGAQNGFAIVPKDGQQYGIIVAYSLPYDRRLEFNHPLSLPAASLTALVPEGVRLRSKQLTDSGTQSYQNQTYHTYEAQGLEAGTTLSLTLSGKPGASAVPLINRQNGLLIGVGALGLALIAAGVFLFLRERRLAAEGEDVEEEQEDKEGQNTDALGNDRDAIMDAIITLDDQYKAGQITKEAYKERRAELKARLREVIEKQ